MKSSKPACRISPSRCTPFTIPRTFPSRGVKNVTMRELERNGIVVAESFGRGSLKSQLKIADRLKVDLTLILGQKEAIDNSVIIRNMSNRSQETIKLKDLPEYLKEIK